MLEVIKFDPDTNIHYVASGFGNKSDWYQNIIKTPQVTVQVGFGTFNAHAERLSAEEAQKIFIEYRNRHPKALKNLAKLIGYNIGKTEADELAFLRLLPVIAFYPQE